MTKLAENPRWYWALVVVVCFSSVTLLVTRLHYGFLPEDDPALSYLAERTLHGELPNADFYDNYTGGLSYLNALALRVFGLRLISLRFMLLLFFVAWIPTVWYVASRITSSLNAILGTLLAAVWSVPVYPAPYGSWYNLYFAIFGTAVLFRYLDTGHRRWIFWGGLCGGLSFLAKIFGLYFLASVGLFLVFDEQNENAESDIRPKVSWSAYSIFITLALLAFTGALVKLINSAGPYAEFMSFLSPYYHFVLPGAALSLFLIYREWSTPRVPARARLLGLGSRVGPFSLGIILPVVVFLAPYVHRHAVAKWYASVLLSAGRVQHAALPPKSDWFVLLCLPLLLVLLANAECKHPRTRAATTAILSVVLGFLLLAARGHLLVSGLVWYSIAESLPVLVVIGVIVLYKKRLAGNTVTKRLMLLLSVAATLSLVQFPFAGAIYFCCVFPFLILVLVALAEETAAYREWHSPLLPVLCFYLLFGIFVILPRGFYLNTFDTVPQTAFMLPRAAGFIGERDCVELYERAVGEVLRHAGNAAIYAGPDSPEFYFLTGHRNPTPIYLDFLAGADAQPQRILNEIDTSGVRTVVINHGGASGYNPSGPPSPELLEGLRERFPQATVIGYFEIRWKSGS